jgi:prophage regulatory protein
MTVRGNTARSNTVTEKMKEHEDLRRMSHRFFKRETANMSQRLIRLPQVKQMIGLRTTAIYERIKQGSFPKPIKLGRNSMWVESEVQEWIAERIYQGRDANQRQAQVARECE